MLMAHPNNNTQYIDRDFQYICLLAKTKTIMKNLMNLDIPNIYNFENYKQILNIGLNTKVFDDVDYLDFVMILNKIDLFYQNEIQNNKYGDLIKDNTIKN